MCEGVPVGFDTEVAVGLVRFGVDRLQSHDVCRAGAHDAHVQLPAPLPPCEFAAWARGKGTRGHAQHDGRVRVFRVHVECCCDRGGFVSVRASEHVWPLPWSYIESSTMVPKKNKIVD